MAQEHPGKYRTALILAAIAARVFPRRHRAALAMVTQTQTQSNLLTMKKLTIVAAAMFGFGFALMPFYQKICEVTGVNNVLKADAVGNTQVDAAAPGARSSSTPTCAASCRGPSARCSRACEVHPGELTTVVYRDTQYVRSRGHRPGDSELRPATGRALFQEARMLLLHAADAAAGRSAADAGRVRDRAGTARRRQHDYAVVYVFRNRRHGQESQLMDMAQAQKAAGRHTAAGDQGGILVVSRHPHAARNTRRTR